MDVLQEEEWAEELIDAQNRMWMSERAFENTIVRVHDKGHMTFREIGSWLGMSHTNVYTLYWKARKRRAKKSTT